MARVVTNLVASIVGQFPHIAAGAVAYLLDGRAVAGHGYWMLKLRVVESRICKADGGFGGRNAAINRSIPPGPRPWRTHPRRRRWPSG